MVKMDLKHNRMAKEGAEFCQTIKNPYKIDKGHTSGKSNKRSTITNYNSSVVL